MKKQKGKLEVIVGSMFSGKSEELMYRLKRAEYAKKNVLTIKHQIDDRMSLSCIVSHNGQERQAEAISSSEQGMQSLISLATEDIEVIGIDEIQFFPDIILPLINRWVELGKRVVVAGLDMDFRKLPFGIVPTLMAIADEVVKLRAICVVCGEEANFTQRLIDSEPAAFNDPIILVGGKECYEARCRSCHKIKLEESCLSQASPIPVRSNH